MAILHKYRTTYHVTEDIKELLEEIGSYEYYRQLELKHLLDNKPIVMSKFFLEAKADGIHLCYSYPLLECSLMIIEGYDNVPLDGWKISRNPHF